MKLNCVKLVGILSLLFLVQETQSQIIGACKHNQFRCSDGSKCLATEKLCNGVKDCPQGEDERGSKQWDCSKTTLSTSCHPENEYKCRYGGCIPRAKLCDNKPDCWGGNDEAVDVCQAAPKQPPRRRPIIVSTTTSPPRGPEVTRGPLPKQPPPSRPRPAQPQGLPRGGGCPGIVEDDIKGFEITCTNEYNKPLSCASPSLPIKSKATYKCKSYYSPPQTGSSQTERICQAGGEWTSPRSSFRCSLKCGRGGNDIVALITGGVTSKKGRWPWHVALYQEEPPRSGKFEFFCGASLISPRAVLTAAHCVTKKNTVKVRDSREIKVVLGKFYRGFNNKRDGQEQDRLVSAIDFHEEYNYYNLDNDIAIIWLDKPALITDRVRPVCLPTDYDYEISGMGQLVGWGRTSNNQFKEELQETKIPVVVSRECKIAHPTFQSLVRRTTFCAGYRNGTSACDGDSGGGLIFQDGDTQQTWRVQGIVSAGIAKPSGGCLENYFSVFTRVNEYLPWINQKLDRRENRR